MRCGLTQSEDRSSSMKGTISGMEDLEQTVSDLKRRIGRTRQEFLKVEMQTCFLAIDVARSELQAGRTDIILWEIAAVAKGVQVIHRFLPDVPQEQRQELSSKLTLLEDALDLLKRDTAARTL